MIFLVSFSVLASCGGKIRYSQCAPESKDFHPKRVAVLAVNTEEFPEAAGVIAGIITGTLTRPGWFQQVVQPEVIKNQLAKNEDLNKTVQTYIQKLKTVSFSDPDLSRKIGEAYDIQAFIVARVTAWSHSGEGAKKIVKIGLEMRLVSTETGKVMWRANHNRMDDYWLLKPDLADMAKGLSREMIDCMPH